MSTTQVIQAETEEMIEIIPPPHAIIKSSRQSSGFSQFHIARLCGISLEQYRRYESGERSIYSASFQTGVKLCYYLGIDLSDLFSLEEP